MKRKREWWLLLYPKTQAVKEARTSPFELGSMDHLQVHVREVKPRPTKAKHCDFVSHNPSYGRCVLSQGHKVPCKYEKRPAKKRGKR